MEQICRFSNVQSLTFTNSISTTPGFAFSNYAGGLVGSTGSGTLTFHVASALGGPTIPLVTSAGAAVTVALNNNAKPLPDECFAAPYLYAVASTATLTCTVFVKG